MKTQLNGCLAGRSNKLNLGQPKRSSHTQRLPAMNSLGGLSPKTKAQCGHTRRQFHTPKESKAKAFLHPHITNHNSLSKGHSSNASHGRGRKRDPPVDCRGILINHEKAQGTEAVTALRNPESTTRRERDWCKRSDATEVPHQEMSSGGSQSSGTTEHAGEGRISCVSFPLRMAGLTVRRGVYFRVSPE